MKIQSSRKGLNFGPGPASAVANALMAALAIAAPVQAQIIFSDVSASGPLAQSELLSESAAWGDVDGDGDEDLYLTNDGRNVLLQNNGDGTFTDVTALSGTGNTAWGVGTAFGDLDNDGDLDLYVVNFNSGPDVLYRNDGIGPGGVPIFTDIGASAGIAIERSSRGMAFIDFDRDGLLDIYVNAIGDDILYRNSGSLTFGDVAQSVGITGNNGQGVGVVATDFNNDGWVDLFTGNRSGDLNRLYRNDQGFFSDITLAAGIDRIGLGMGVLAADLNNDLAIDLYWTTWPDDGSNGENALYQNVGADSFVDRAVASGTDDAYGWGISTNAADIDLDGWMDFAVSNGFDDTSSKNVLFRNDGNGGFDERSNALSGGTLFDGRGVAFADYDHDGDEDLIVTADAGVDNRLWRNDSVTGHRWIKLLLVGTASNRSAIGARVEVATPLTNQVQEVSGGAGRGSFNSLPLVFGLGQAESIESLTVRWPSGLVESFSVTGLDRQYMLVEGRIFADDFESDPLRSARTSESVPPL